MNTVITPQEVSNLEIIKNLHEKACSRGDLEALSKLYFDRKLFPVDNVLHNAWLSFIGVFKATPDFHVMEGRGFTLACKNGHLPIIDFLLNSAKYKDSKVISLGCLGAIAHGHLDVAKFLAPMIIKNPEFEQVAHQVLTEICLKGDLEALKYYMFTNKKLDVQIDKLLNCSFGDFSPAHAGFITACEEGHLDIVKYLTNSPELSSHVDIDKITEKINIKNSSVIRYFIFDLNLEKEHNLFKQIVCSDPQLIERLFEKKKLFENLTSEEQKREDNGNITKRKYKL